MRNQLFSAIKVITLAVILSFGLSYAIAWTAPATTPPGGNVDAPINTSATAQTKVGNFTANRLFSTASTSIGTTLSTQLLTVAGNIGATGDICTALGGGKCLSTAALGGSFGPGYMWSNVSATRAYSTTYTNSTGNPIYVHVNCCGTGTGILTYTVGGVTLSQQESSNAFADINFIVPSGAAYSVNASAGGPLRYWNELRCDSGLNCSAGSNVPGSLGVDQTWQDVTGTRASGVSYTNSTGKPIMVAITHVQSLALYAGGVLVGNDQGSNNNTTSFASFIVPVGSTYSITAPQFSRWAELR